MSKNGHFHKMWNSPLHEKHKNQQNAQNEKQKITQNWSKNIKKRGGLNPALKPGPVVPPGIEKTPDQAARNSQSVDFGHLSDILAFFRGGSFFVIFFTFFTFLISYFFTFCIFWFLCFITFSVFLIFAVFVFWWFWSIFVTFSCYGWFLITFCV